MKRQELISSKEYWSTKIALALWTYNGSRDDDFDTYGKMAESIVDDDFIKVLEEYRSQPTESKELPGDDKVNNQSKVSCKGNSHAMRYHHMLEQFRDGAKWMRSIASPLLASKDARIRELEDGVSTLMKFHNEKDNEIKELKEKIQFWVNSWNVLSRQYDEINNKLTPPKN